MRLWRNRRNGNPFFRERAATLQVLSQPLMLHSLNCFEAGVFYCPLPQPQHCGLGRVLFLPGSQIPQVSTGGEGGGVKPGKANTPSWVSLPTTCYQNTVLRRILQLYPSSIGQNGVISVMSASPWPRAE